MKSVSAIDGALPLELLLETFICCNCWHDASKLQSGV